jgi:Aspartyl protease
VPTPRRSSPRRGTIRGRALLGLAVLLTGAAHAAAATMAPPVPGLPFDSQGGCVVLRAIIDDGHDARLLLDTGDATGLTLHEAFARRTGLTLGDPVTREASGIAGAARVEVRPGRVDNLAIGAIRWRDVEILAAPPSPADGAGRCGDLDGIIGVGLLGELRITVDYPGRRITMERGGERGGGSRLRLVGMRPLVEVHLQDGAARIALLDTASAASLIDRSERARTLVDRGAAVRLVDGAGAGIAAVPRRLEGLEAGGSILQPLRVVPLDLARRLATLLPAGAPRVSLVLGADALSRHVVVFDFPQGEFRIQDP